MAAASALIDRLKALLEGTAASPVPRRTIPTGRFRWVELDQDQVLAAATGRPYPCGVLEPRKYQPMETPSEVAADHVWRGEGVVLWIAYAYDEHDRTERMQEILDDEVTVHRCLSDPLSWLVDGIGIVGVDEADIRDDTETRLLVLTIDVRAEIGRASCRERV